MECYFKVLIDVLSEKVSTDVLLKCIPRLYVSYNSCKKYRNKNKIKRQIFKMNFSELTDYKFL